MHRASDTESAGLNRDRLGTDGNIRHQEHALAVVGESLQRRAGALNADRQNENSGYGVKTRSIALSLTSDYRFTPQFGQ